MAEVKRVSPQEARERVQSGNALIVCAYDGDDLFKQMHLEGGISLSELKSRLPLLSKTQEIIFYCA